MNEINNLLIQRTCLLLVLNTQGWHSSLSYIAGEVATMENISLLSNIYSEFIHKKQIHTKAIFFYK